MSTLDGPNLRRHSMWLTLAVSMLFVGITLSATWIQRGSSALLARPGTESARVGLVDGTSVSGAYQSPQLCRECHQDEYDDWTHTTHASASVSPNFRRLLQSSAQPGECFACHTTGYSAANGQFLLAGVTCEACHGPYRPGHPEASMAIANSTALCGDCHTDTLADWQQSRHGQAGVTCVACHEVHTQRTRESVITNALCADCHEVDIRNPMHLDHLVTSVHCVDCHVPRLPIVAASLVGSGHALMDHTFTVQSTTCINCHEITTDFP